MSFPLEASDVAFFAAVRAYNAAHARARDAARAYLAASAATRARATAATRRAEDNALRDYLSADGSASELFCEIFGAYTRANDLRAAHAFSTRDPLFRDYLYGARRRANEVADKAYQDRAEMFAAASFAQTFAQTFATLAASLDRSPQLEHASQGTGKLTRIDAVALALDMLPQLDPHGVTDLLQKSAALAALAAAAAAELQVATERMSDDGQEIDLTLAETAREELRSALEILERMFDQERP